MSFFDKIIKNYYLHDNAYLILGIGLCNCIIKKQQKKQEHQIILLYHDKNLDSIKNDNDEDNGDNEDDGDDGDNEDDGDDGDELYEYINIQNII